MIGPQGLDGVSVIGPQGFQGQSMNGPQGLEGAIMIGPQGLEGVSVIGQRGFQGVNGPQGLEGQTSNGPQGFQGASVIGPQGLEGPISTGPQGYQGQSLIGPQGSIGPIGANGPSGGPQGPIGPVGLTGAQGGLIAVSLPQQSNPNLTFTNMILNSGDQVAHFFTVSRNIVQLWNATPISARSATDLIAGTSCSLRVVVPIGVPLPISPPWVMGLGTIAQDSAEIQVPIFSSSETTSAGSVINIVFRPSCPVITTSLFNFNFQCVYNSS